MIDTEYVCVTLTFVRSKASTEAADVLFNKQILVKKLQHVLPLNDQFVDGISEEAGRRPSVDFEESFQSRYFV